MSRDISGNNCCKLLLKNTEDQEAIQETAASLVAAIKISIDVAATAAVLPELDNVSTFKGPVCKT